MTFGRLSKLRYLDLKGNPLQPALLKVVGPCLTTKDCLDAAKKIVPFMSDLEVEFRAEQMKKEEEEQKQKEAEAAEAREQTRLAKKAARKERVMRERQEKAETENSEPLTETVARTTTKTSSNIKHTDAPRKQPLKSAPSKSNFLSFLKTFMSVIIFFVFMSFMFLKFLPNQSDNVLSLLPKQQQHFLRIAFETIDGSILSLFNKALNFYKM